MGQFHATKHLPIKNANSIICENWKICWVGINFSSTLFCVLIGDLQIKVIESRFIFLQFYAYSLFVCIKEATNRKSSQLIKWLKLEVYIPDSVREKERGENTSTGRILSLFKRGKWVLGEQRRDKR